MLLRQIDGFAARFAGHDLIAPVAKIVGEEVEDIPVILHNQNVDFGHPFLRLR